MDDTKISGEYWIIEGSVDFADGDVGDTNHAMIANNHVVHQFVSEIESLADEYGLETELERYGEVDSEQIATVIDEVYERLLEQGISSKEIYQIIQDKIGADAEALQILRGGGDSRLYVMKHDGWIAVRSNNAELFGYDSSKQRYLARGIGDILFDEGNEHFNPSEVEIAIYDHKNRRSWYVTLEELENPNVAVKSQQQAQTTYNKPIIPTSRPSTAPQSYPNKWSQAAQDTGIIGPGQDLWRGTSECLNFKEFFENVESQHTTMQVHIPMPSQVEILSNLFHKHGLELKPVGGAVRDYLFAHFHGDVKKYNPKDIDLATNASPDQVESLLQGPEGQRYGIKVIPKGKAFGVISALFPPDPADPNKNQEYEIATYREEWYDPEGPGRRPDDVRFSTAAADAKRRDLTMNALFYDPKSQQVIDYNVNAEGKGQGIEDIKNRTARFVGNPRERIREDKLRILRLIRFFSRYNPGEIAQHMDQETVQAIGDFKHLAGVSPERITNEFLGGLEKAINPVSYLKNYMSVGRDSVSHPYGLLSMVFPNLKIDVGDIDRIEHVKNPKAVLAWLLKGNPDVARKLRDLKYPSDIFDVVDFLLKLYRFNPNSVSGLLSKRDIYKQEKNEKLRSEKKSIMQKDIMDFAKIANMEDVLGRFVNYQRQANAKDFMHLKGAEIGKAMANHETNAYLKSMGG